MCEAVFVCSRNYAVDCFSVDVFFSFFPPQILTLLYSCLWFLSDNVSCHFSCWPERVFDSCTDRFTGGGSEETSGDDSKRFSLGDVTDTVYIQIQIL